MFNLLLWIISVVLSIVFFSDLPKVVIFIFISTANIVWLIITVCCIQDKISMQIKNMTALKRIMAQKKKAINELFEYKKELKEILVDKYFEFEKALMASIKDSKLMVAALEKGDHGKLLSEYHSKLSYLLTSVYDCDVDIAIIIERMEDRQARQFFNNAMFIPEKYILMESTKTIYTSEIGQMNDAQKIANI